MQKAKGREQLNNHHHSRNMVWKIRRNGREPSHSAVVTNSKGGQAKKLKSCLKKDASDQHSRSGCSASSASSRRNCDSTKSGGSRTGSRISNTSLRSKRDESRKDEPSCTSSSRSSTSSHSHSSRQQHSAEIQVGSHHSAPYIGEKLVRFSEIHVREFERIVGDNPSCSAGPPIGLGWAYAKTRVAKVESYEDARPHRKSQVSMVLTRDDREKLLLHWGYSFDDIVAAIRTNIKVKNQRRQTVTNLGKVERLEEAFESATRKLKRVVLLRRSTADEVKEMQEQAELAASALASLKIAEDRALGEIASGSVPTEHEPDEDHLASLDVQVAVSDFCRHSPIDAMMRSPTMIIPRDDEPFDDLTMDGLSFGNSTSASVLEMEKFYKELELEMFGDDMPPSMVGQTLEVPVQIAADEIENYRRTVEPESTLYSPPTSVEKSNQVHSSRLNIVNPQVDSRLKNNVRLDPEDSDLPKDPARSMLSHAMEASEPEHHPRYRHYLDVMEAAPLVHHHHHQQVELDQHNYVFRHSPSYAMHDVDVSNPRNEHLQNARLSSSLDSAYVETRPDLSATSMHPPMHVSGGHHVIPPRPVPTVQSVYPINFHHHHQHVHGNGYHTQVEDFSSLPPHYPSYQAERTIAGNTIRSDEPRVQHIPPSTYQTPSHWMEHNDYDSPMIRRTYEPVTITEDAYGAGSGGPQQLRRGEPVFNEYRVPREPPRYPASFY